MCVWNTRREHCGFIEFRVCGGSLWTESGKGIKHRLRVYTLKVPLWIFWHQFSSEANLPSNFSGYKQYKFVFVLSSKFTSGPRLKS